PAVTEAYRAVNPESLTIRAPVSEHVTHPLEASFLERLPRIELNDPRDPTHSQLARCLPQGETGDLLARGFILAEGAQEEAREDKVRRIQQDAEYPRHSTIEDHLLDGNGPLSPEAEINPREATGLHETPFQGVPIVGALVE